MYRAHREQKKHQIHTTLSQSHTYTYTETQNDRGWKKSWVWADARTTVENRFKVISPIVEIMSHKTNMQNHTKTPSYPEQIHVCIFFLFSIHFILTARKFGYETYLFYIEIMILFQFVVFFSFVDAKSSVNVWVCFFPPIYIFRYGFGVRVDRMTWREKNEKDFRREKCKKSNDDKEIKSSAEMLKSLNIVGDYSMDTVAVRYFPFELFLLMYSAKMPSNKTYQKIVIIVLSTVISSYERHPQFRRLLDVCASVFFRSSPALSSR